jgi:hypothetical protein
MRNVAGASHSDPCRVPTGCYGLGYADWIHDAGYGKAGFIEVVGDMRRMGNPSARRLEACREGGR